MVGPASERPGYVEAVALLAWMVIVAAYVVMVQELEHMDKEIVQEAIQGLLAVITLCGSGYLLAFHPEVDRTVATVPAATILGFYFGAKAALSTPGGKSNA